MIVFNALVTKLSPLCSIKSQPSQSKILAMCLRTFMKLLVHFSVFSRNLIPNEPVILLFDLFIKKKFHFYYIIQSKSTYSLILPLDKLSYMNKLIAAF